MEVKSIKHNAIMNGILSVLQVIFPLITFPYISRVLGVEANGRLTFASSLVSYFTLFSTLGITTYGIKACAQARDDKDSLSKTVHELLLFSSVTTSVVLAVLIATVAFVPRLRMEYELIAINGFTLVLNVSGMNWLYSGIEQYDYITIRSVVFKLLSLIMMFLFVHNSTDIYVYACITVFATVGSNILNILHSKRYLYYRWYGNYNLRQHLRPTLTLFAALLAVNVYTNLDNVMLGFITNDYQVGIYHASVRIKSVLTAMVTSLGAVLLPRVSNYLKNNQKSNFYNVLKKSFSFTCMTGISLVIYFFVFARESILLLSGAQYLDSVIPMRILIILIVVTGFSNILGMQILIPSNCENKYMIAVMLGACSDLVLNALLIPNFGAVGAAIATLFAELMQFFVQIFFVRDVLKQIVDGRAFLQVIIACAVALIVVLPIKIFTTLNVFWLLVITGFLYYVIFALALWALKYALLTDLLVQVTNKRLKR